MNVYILKSNDLLKRNPLSPVNLGGEGEKEKLGVSLQMIQWLYIYIYIYIYHLCIHNPSTQSQQHGNRYNGITKPITPRSGSVWFCARLAFTKDVESEAHELMSL